MACGYEHEKRDSAPCRDILLFPLPGLPVVILTTWLPSYIRGHSNPCFTCSTLDSQMRDVSPSLSQPVSFQGTRASPSDLVQLAERCIAGSRVPIPPSNADEVTLGPLSILFTLFFSHTLWFNQPSIIPLPHSLPAPSRLVWLHRPRPNYLPPALQRAYFLCLNSQKQITMGFELADGHCTRPVGTDSSPPSPKLYANLPAGSQTQTQSTVRHGTYGYEGASEVL